MKSGISKRSGTYSNFGNSKQNFFGEDSCTLPPTHPVSRPSLLWFAIWKYWMFRSINEGGNNIVIVHLYKDLLEPTKEGLMFCVILFAYILFAQKCGQNRDLIKWISSRWWFKFPTEYADVGLQTSNSCRMLVFIHSFQFICSRDHDYFCDYRCLNLCFFPFQCISRRWRLLK